MYVAADTAAKINYVLHSDWHGGFFRFVCETDAEKALTDLTKDSHTPTFHLLLPLPPCPPSHCAGTRNPLRNSLRYGGLVKFTGEYRILTIMWILWPHYMIKWYECAETGIREQNRSPPPGKSRCLICDTVDRDWNIYEQGHPNNGHWHLLTVTLNFVSSV